MSESLEIVPYDSGWPEQFERERQRLAAGLGDLALRIDHNGSTSVAGLPAKPVIDIQVSVARLRPPSLYKKRLEKLGYVHVPHADDSFCPFFHRPATWPHTHHVHLVEHGALEERRTLAFRDFLREHDLEARAYAALKMDLAARLLAGELASREAYAEAKTDFIEAIIERALAAGYPRDLDV
jgi:GrpB-like predicted nucleotidyltransferase (UPF0157 family)